MKKIVILILTALLIFGSAFALSSSGYPVYDGTPISENAFAGMFDADPLLLAFDASADFSMCANGYLQACFFAMNATGESYIEIYLVLPQQIAAGDVLTPASTLQTGMLENSISFYEVEQTRETFYIAMQDEAGRYPEASDYEIRIDSFAETDSAYVVRGTLTAVLAEIEELAPTGRVLHLTDVQFDFTLPKSAAASAAPTPLPTPEPFASPAPFFPFASAAPDPTHAPADSVIAPAFTLPADYVKV